VVKTVAQNARKAMKNPGVVRASMINGLCEKLSVVNAAAKAGPNVKPTMAVIPFSNNARLRVLRLTCAR
jgi:hypothetical protein